MDGFGCCSPCNSSSPCVLEKLASTTTSWEVATAPPWVALLGMAEMLASRDISADAVVAIALRVPESLSMRASWVNEPEDAVLDAAL